MLISLSELSGLDDRAIVVYLVILAAVVLLVRPGTRAQRAMLGLGHATADALLLAA
jgi:hypothetical protein